VCKICLRRVTGILRRVLKLIDIRAKGRLSHSGRHDGDAKENDRTRFAVVEMISALLDPPERRGKTVYLYTPARTPRMASIQSEKNASVAVK
jgi:hypothetical protein